MAYQVLARKWRPHDFEAVVGQEPVVTALRNALAEGRIASAYLFSGIRGVGKTSVARILAKALNCERGMADGPCNECETCREFGSGANLDILEIDAATHSKVEQVRELTENLKYKPVSGRYKVVVLDEVHRLSRNAFDALLKIVEEPPPHLVFIFATTELEAVPATILSRCQEFNFRRVPHPQLVAHLRRLADAEEIEVGDKALMMIARAGEGSVRDSVALLDQLATYGSGAIRDEDAIRVLGGADTSLHHTLLDAIVRGDRSGVVEIVADVEGRGRDPRHVYGDFLGYCRDVLHLALGGDPATVELPNEEAEAARALGTSTGYETVLRLLHLLLAGEEAVRRSESAALAVEIAWLRAAELPRLTSLEALLGGESSGGVGPAAPQGEGQAGGKSSPGGGREAAAALGAASGADAVPAKDERPAAVSAPARSADDRPTVAEPPLSAPPEPEAPEPVVPEPAASESEVLESERHADVSSQPEPATTGATANATGDLGRFVELIRTRRQVIAAHLDEVEKIDFVDRALVLTTGEGDGWLATALRRDANRKAFEACLHEAFGDDATWRIETAPAANGETASRPPSSDSRAPSSESESPTTDSESQAPTAADSLDHPTVQAALDVFGGTAEPIEETN